MTDPDAPRQAPDGCAAFIAYVRSYFEDLLQKHAFGLVECLCLHEGRECTALYQSPRQRLLFELSDGAFHVLIGSLTAPFPGGNQIDHAGRTGWYALFLLVEFKSGRRVYTEKLIQQIWNAQVDPYRFEASLLAQWGDRVLPMFEPHQEEKWREEFRGCFPQKTPRRA